MCLPPDDIRSSPHCIGKGRGVNVARWAVDQRPFVWASASRPTEKPPAGSVWTAWTDTFYPGAPLPYSGLLIDDHIQTKPGVPDETFEAESSLSLGLRPSAPIPVPKESKILQTKVWEARPNGREAAAAPGMSSFLCSPPFRPASGLDMRQPSLSRIGSVVCRTPSPLISVPIVQEGSESTKVPRPVYPCETSRLKEDKSLKSSCVEGLIEEVRAENGAVLKRKLGCSSPPPTGKTSTSSYQKARHCNNLPVASKTEISTRSGDVSMSESLADNEDPSDDEDDGGPGVSEKRRRRMLSNRASAQRSRQRRQERLDTLEVLVAELRVENAALSRRAGNAVTAAKKLEEENKILRGRLRKQEPVRLSDSNGSIESDKTTENSEVDIHDNVEVHDNNGPPWNGDMVSGQNDSSNRSEETCLGKTFSQANGGALNGKCGDELVENSKRWKNNFSSGGFEFDFSSDLSENGGYLEMFNRTTLPENSRGENVKDLYQSSAIMSGATNDESFRGRDPFAMDLETCNLEMEKTDLDSKSVEDIWLDSLANCLK